MPLFKYLHPDRIDVLSGQAIRFSSPAVLNDPFELKPHLAALASQKHLEAQLDRLLPEIVDEELSKLPIELRAQIFSEALAGIVLQHLPKIKNDVHALAKLLMPKLQTVMARKFEELVGILCLSETPENLLMWAHYADSHRGFLLAFDETSPFFDRRIALDDELRHLRKVIYTSQRPALVLAEVEDFSPFMTKGMDWEYEAEWRMLMTLDSASKIFGEGANAVHLFNFPADAVIAVVLGCRMTEEKKTEIRKLLAGSSHYAHVRCVDAEIDDERYQVRIPLPGI